MLFLKIESHLYKLMYIVHVYKNKFARFLSVVASLRSRGVVCVAEVRTDLTPELTWSLSVLASFASLRCELT